MNNFEGPSLREQLVGLDRDDLLRAARHAFVVAWLMMPYATNLERLVKDLCGSQ